MPQKCQHNLIGCVRDATDVIKWKTATMSAPAFWYLCKPCADHCENVKHNRVVFERRQIGTSLDEQQRALEDRVRAAGAAVKAIPGVGMGEAGLTPDTVKLSPEYQEAQRRYRMAFAALREFNGKHAKKLQRARRAV